MPKTISSLPTGAINRTDNLITATDGSDELKRNTVDELLAGPTADITALQTENAELKAQIAEMEEKIAELSSDLTQLIVAKSFSQTVTVEANSNYHGEFDVTLDGYTPLGIIEFYFAISFARFWRVEVDGNTAYLNFRNDDSSSYTSTLRFTVLYLKNS